MFGVKTVSETFFNNDVKYFNSLFLWYWHEKKENNLKYYYVGFSDRI